MRRFIFTLLTFLFFGCLAAQESSGKYQENVASLDNIVQTLYDVISGDAGVERDWDLFRYLFTENAHLIPITDNNTGKPSPVFLTPESYIERSGSYLVENGFFEKETHRVTETYGALTHIFSTYEAFRTSSDQTPFMRGINSIQLVNDGSRWWITNIQWFRESEANPLPAKYLPKN